MEKISINCPPPLLAEVEEFQNTKGYENTSQAVRELLRRSLYQAEMEETAP